MNKIILTIFSVLLTFNAYAGVKTDTTSEEMSVDSCQVSAAPVTVSFWFKAETTAQDGVAFWFGDKDSGARYISLGFSTQSTNYVPWAFARYDNNNHMYGSTDLDDGAWHHFLMTYIDTSTLKVYVDNSLEIDGSPTLGTDPITLCDRMSLFHAGDSSKNDWIDDFTIDEIAVWNVELSAAQIEVLSHKIKRLPLQVARGNLQNYWSTDEKYDGWDYDDGQDAGSIIDIISASNFSSNGGGTSGPIHYANEVLTYQ